MSDRFIREPERLDLTGLSWSTWWRLDRQGLVPKRRQISPNSVGWLLSEIEEWIASRTLKRGALGS